MPRQTSERVAQAVAMVKSGMSAYKAALVAGVAQSSVSRAIQREESRCPCCGQVVRGKLAPQPTSQCPKTIPLFDGVCGAENGSEAQ